MVCPALSPNGTTKRSPACGRAVFGSSAAAAESLPKTRPRPTAAFNRVRRSRYNVPIVETPPPRDVLHTRRIVHLKAVSKRMPIGTVTLDTCNVKRYTLKKLLRSPPDYRDGMMTTTATRFLILFPKKTVC